MAKTAARLKAGDELAPVVPMRSSSSSTALVAVRQLPADQHPVAVYLAGLGQGSRRTMAQALDTIAGILSERAPGGPFNRDGIAWAALRYQHTGAVRAKLAETFAPATANKMLSALRGVLKEAWRLGQLDSEDYRQAVDLKSIKASTELRGRQVEAGELRALFGACAEDDNATIGARDAAVLGILFAAGLRRSEVVKLDLGDFAPETGALRIRRSKGRKTRTVYLDNGALDAVLDWLKVRGSAPGALLLPVNKAGALQPRRMSAETVRKMLATRATAACVKAFSPHDARRTFISEALDAGVDLATAQALAGHADPKTTARYDRRGERAKKAAAGRIAVPYVPRRG